MLFSVGVLRLNQVGCMHMHAVSLTLSLMASLNMVANSNVVLTIFIYFIFVFLIDLLVEELVIRVHMLTTDPIL